MGSIKDNVIKKQPQGADHPLSEDDVKMLRLMNQSRMIAYNEAGKVMSAYLYQIATSKLGFSKEKNLEFNVDLEAEAPTLTVTVL